MVAVTDAEEYHEEAADLTDEQLHKAAGLLRLDDLAESDDIPQFLAIARESAERTTGCDHSTCSCSGRCACSPGT